MERVGGKGASLSRLASAGLPVPPGFHVTTAAYKLFVKENKLQEQILTAVAEADVEQPGSLNKISQRIAGLFASGTMPEVIRRGIRRAYSELGGGKNPVVVRSSALPKTCRRCPLPVSRRVTSMYVEKIRFCRQCSAAGLRYGLRELLNIVPDTVSLRKRLVWR